MSYNHNNNNKHVFYLKKYVKTYNNKHFEHLNLKKNISV